MGWMTSGFAKTVGSQVGMLPVIITNANRNVYGQTTPKKVPKWSSNVFYERGTVVEYKGERFVSIQDSFDCEPSTHQSRWKAIYSEF